MREILFRGKRTDNGEWVEGCYLQEDKRPKETFIEWFERGSFFPTLKRVIPETVGQYTGLCDKNGNKIFEGDIVKTKYGRLCLIKWLSTGCFCGIDLIPIEVKSRKPHTWDLYCSENLEVVSNIHDNPELLEVLNNG